MRPAYSAETREKIREDREIHGMTLTALIRKYGGSKSTMFNVIDGMSDVNVKIASPSRKVVVQESVAKERPSLSKVDLGEASRQMICARLMLSGVKVFRPLTEDTTTDLLILASSGKVLKCQCKYIYPQENGRHVMNLYTTRVNRSNGRCVKHRYSPDEVDFFLGYCFDNDGVYVVPNVDTGNLMRLSFWVIRKSFGSNGKGIDTGKYLGKWELLR